MWGFRGLGLRDSEAEVLGFYVTLGFRGLGFGV